MLGGRRAAELLQRLQAPVASDEPILRINDDRMQQAHLVDAASERIDVAEVASVTRPDKDRRERGCHALHVRKRAPCIGTICSTPVMSTSCSSRHHSRRVVRQHHLRGDRHLHRQSPGE